jgi:hypothetical protein
MRALTAVVVGVVKRGGCERTSDLGRSRVGRKGWEAVKVDYYFKGLISLF